MSSKMAVRMSQTPDYVGGGERHGEDRLHGAYPAMRRAGYGEGGRQGPHPTVYLRVGMMARVASSSPGVKRSEKPQLQFAREIRDVKKKRIRSQVRQAWGPAQVQATGLAFPALLLCPWVVRAVRSRRGGHCCPSCENEGPRSGVTSRGHTAHAHGLSVAPAQHTVIQLQATLRNPRDRPPEPKLGTVALAAPSLCQTETNLCFPLHSLSLGFLAIRML